MKRFFMLFFISANAFAQCAFIECMNPCTHSKIQLEGDKCALTWNKTLGCFEAYAECGDSHKCLGALCFDSCSGTNHYYAKANTCDEVFNPALGCWSAIARCE